MAQKPKSSVKPDDPAEYERFLATAKDVGADESTEGFERAFKKIIAAPQSKPAK